MFLFSFPRSILSLFFSTVSQMVLLGYWFVFSSLERFALPASPGLFSESGRVSYVTDYLFYFVRPFKVPGRFFLGFLKFTLDVLHQRY